MRELQLAKNTVIDWKQFCRDICHEYFILNPIQLGGIGRTIDIDESCIVRRKYNRGHLVREQWVFVGSTSAASAKRHLPEQLEIQGMSDQQLRRPPADSA